MVFYLRAEDKLVFFITTFMRLVYLSVQKKSHRYALDGRSIILRCKIELYILLLWAIVRKITIQE